MRVIILGSAAGGGVPQWNCGCRNCTEARHTNRSRTQSSVAVSADGERWILLNASPDLRTQLAAHRPLWPPSGSRATPVRAVVLTDGEIDHTLGLLLLRESADRLPVYAPAGVTALLGDEWPIYRVLSAYSGVEPRVLEEDRPIALADRAARSEEHTSELQSRLHLVCRLLLEKKKTTKIRRRITAPQSVADGPVHDSPIRLAK